jgi:Fe-S-cluster-containing dehydrogenase component
VEAALFALAGELNSRLRLGLDARLFSSARSEFQNASAKSAYDALLSDLASRGRAVVMAGPQLSPQAHAMAAALNHGLGSIGGAVAYTAEEQPLRQAHMDALADFSERLKSGAFDTVIVIGGNPVYDAPASLNLAEGLGHVRNSIHLSLHDNETSRTCKWSLPRAHYLEEWGDARGYDGSYSVVQPLIEPLYGGTSAHELLALLLDGSQRKGYDLVRETFQELTGANGFEQRWSETLHDGLLKDSAAAQFAPQALIASSLQPLAPAGGDELELLLVPDYSVYDGRFANNGWLQETPDPMTKLTWDNALLLGINEAQKRGVGHETVVTVSGGGGSVKLPVYVLPGIPDGVAIAALGYGRAAAGDVGNGVGSNTYALRTVDAPYWTNVTLAAAADIHYFAETQDHFAIDTRGFEERGIRTAAIVREANVATWEKHPDFAKRMQHAPAEVSRWQDWTYPDTTQNGQRATHRWGMSIDLAACMGCSACVTACTAENNIPVVGKLRVRQGREMLWLRVDRYFRTAPKERDPLARPGELNDPKVALMPLTCHHCEMAPCEQVCPVNATTHSDEGLNDMVYNRCIGTRYCSNNCPFKVRRFNFFNYQKSLTETQKLVHNTQVTIRSRGVMEKCTYCVQRIQNGKISARVAGRELADGEVKTACQQTCPTEAISFGDLNNHDSRVRELRFGVHSDRSYTLLDELQVRPRTSYMAAVWNPAPGTDEFAAPEPHLVEHEGGHAPDNNKLSPGPSPEQLSAAESGHVETEAGHSEHHHAEEEVPAGH